jgi:hypothetical protein
MPRVVSVCPLITANFCRTLVTTLSEAIRLQEDRSPEINCHDYRGVDDASIYIDMTHFASRRTRESNSEHSEHEARDGIEQCISKDASIASINTRSTHARPLFPVLKLTYMKKTP